jgi:TolB protein
VNSPGNEFSPMLSPDGATLLFSSDRTGGAGGHDLYTAGRKADAFAPAMRLPGTLNSAANEFDATYLRDGRTIVFARAMDFQRDRVDLYQSAPQLGGYGSGARLPESVNGPLDTYGAMLDWSDPAWLTFSGRRDAAPTMSLYRIRYRLVPAGG